MKLLLSISSLVFGESMMTGLPLRYESFEMTIALSSFPNFNSILQPF